MVFECAYRRVASAPTSSRSASLFQIVFACKISCKDEAQVFMVVYRSSVIV